MEYSTQSKQPSQGKLPVLRKASNIFPMQLHDLQPKMAGRLWVVCSNTFLLSLRKMSRGERWAGLGLNRHLEVPLVHALLSMTLRLRQEAVVATVPGRPKQLPRRFRRSFLEMEMLGFPPGAVAGDVTLFPSLRYRVRHVRPSWIPFVMDVTWVKGWYGFCWKARIRKCNLNGSPQGSQATPPERFQICETKGALWWRKTSCSAGWERGWLLLDILF